ncbi:hypothetical protein ACHAWF_001260, partial [Thalassiosira exigua]
GLVTDTIIPELASDAVDLLFNSLFGTSGGSDSSQVVATQLEHINSGINELKAMVDSLSTQLEGTEFRTRYSDLLTFSLTPISQLGNDLQDCLMQGQENVGSCDFVPDHFHKSLNDWVGLGKQRLVDNALGQSPINFYVTWVRHQYPATGLRGVRQDIVDLVNNISAMLGRAFVIQSILEKAFPDANYIHRQTMIGNVRDAIYQMWFFIGASYPTLDGQSNHFYFKSKLSSKGI